MKLEWTDAGSIVQLKGGYGVIVVYGTDFNWHIQSNWLSGSYRSKQQAIAAVETAVRQTYGDR
jgi:hypothetical protein